MHGEINIIVKIHELHGKPLSDDEIEELRVQVDRVVWTTLGLYSKEYDIYITHSGV